MGFFDLVCRPGWGALGLALVFACGTREADAFETRGELGALRYSVFAPDWTWLGETLSVLVIVEAPSGAPRAMTTVRATLDLPLTLLADPSTDVRRRQVITVAPGSTARFAFGDIGLASGVDPGRFDCRLAFATVVGEAAVEVAESAQDALVLRFQIDTVRGAAVPKGVWSVLVPAAMALLTLPAFLWILKRFGARRWWRESVKIDVPVGEEWWKSEA